MKRSFKSMFGSRFRAGSYSSFSAAIVIAIAIVANLMASSLPAAKTQLDMTGNDLYSLSAQTKQIVSGLTKDVHLYLLASSGREDATISRLLERYSSLSSHLTVTNLDPTANPTFLRGYDLSMNSLYENSVLVDCGGNYRLVGYDQIYVTDYSMDYSTYSYSTSTSFAGESALTTAIHYVTSDNLPRVFVLTGHGETALSDSLTDMMASDGILAENVSLFAEDTIPEDVTAVVINAPQSDLSEDEAQLLIDYLTSGGSVFLTTDYIEDGKLSNLLRVTQSMGLTAQSGIIIEGDRNLRLNRYPHYLLPNSQGHEITDAVTSAGYVILVPVAQPIVQIDGSDASVTMLLNTSSEAYAKQAGLSMTTTERESGDTSGPFSVAAVSELDEGKLFWVSSSYFLDDYVSSMVSGANSDVFLNALNWMGHQEQSISIRAKSMDTSGLTLSGAESSRWSAIMIFVIPLCFVATGITVWMRRKQR